MTYIQNSKYYIKKKKKINYTLKEENCGLASSRVNTSNFPTGSHLSFAYSCSSGREGALVNATRMTGKAAARGGYSCIGEVTVSGNRVRAGASGTRRRSVTRPTDPLKRLELSLSRLLRARCSFLYHCRRRRRRRRPSSPGQVPAQEPLCLVGAIRVLVMVRRYANAIPRLRERDREPDRRSCTVSILEDRLRNARYFLLLNVNNERLRFSFCEMLSTIHRHIF